MFTFGEANADGSDIRFSRNGTALPYEIELWDVAGSQADFWVKLDTVMGNSVTTFTIHWGNASASDESNGSAVFDTAQGFAGVWHLNEAAVSAEDATANGLSGSFLGDLPDHQSTGMIAGAQDFDGDGDYIRADDDPALDVSGSDLLTLSAWVNKNGKAVDGWWNGIAGKFGWTSGNNREYALTWKVDQGFAFHLSSDGTDGAETIVLVEDDGLSDDHTWYHLVGIADGSSAVLYINGVERGRSAHTSGIHTSAAGFDIGRLDGNQTWKGLIDEVRVSGEPRSADWVKLSYETQKPASIVGGPIAATCTDESLSAADVTAPEGGTATLTGVAECAVYARWVTTSDSVIANGMTASLPIGRISGNTTYTLRFEAYFMGTGWKTADLTLTLTDAIPDPEFTLNAPGGSWNGIDTLYVIATIDNLTDIQNSLFPDISSTWTTSGVIVSRTPMGDTLMVRNARESGTLIAKFCADNGGPEVCDSISVTVEVQDPITVLTPNGGEELTGGSVYNVTWESVGAITQIHIQYQLDGGAWSTAAINQENTGTYAWTVPNTPSASVLLRVVSATGGLLDMSDAPFTIVAGNSSVRAYRSSEGIVFQIKGLNRIETGGYDYQRIEIMDLNGGLVKELDITGNRVTWNLEGNSGSRAANGIYLVRLIGMNRTSEFKVLVE
jgi:hypothetical protein